MREASSVTIIERLLAAGAKVSVYDPRAMHTARGIFGDEVEYAESAAAATADADAIVLVTEWAEFRSPDFPGIKALMKTPVVFDGRNIYDPTMLRQAGFTYYGVGRPA